MEKIDDYLQINEAAAYLGISPSTLRNWEKQGKLTTHRNPINSYRLYKKKDLENLLKSIRIQAPLNNCKDLTWIN